MSTHDFDCKNGIQHSRRLCAVAVRILNLESKAVKDRPQPAKHGRSRPIFRGILVCAHSITAMAHYCDVVGIDLGTTRSSIAVWDGTQVSMPISAHMTIYSAPLSVPWKRKALAAIGASMLQQRQGVQGLSEKRASFQVHVIANESGDNTTPSWVCYIDANTRRVGKVISNTTSLNLVRTPLHTGAHHISPLATEFSALVLLMLAPIPIRSAVPS